MWGDAALELPVGVLAYLQSARRTDLGRQDPTEMLTCRKKTFRR